MALTKNATLEYLGLPDEFQVRPRGIYRRIGKADGSTWQWLCSPIQVLGLTRDAGSAGWGLYLKVVDPDGHPHLRAFPARLLATDGPELRAALFDLGLELAPGRENHLALVRLLSGWRPPNRIRTTERLGWSDATCTAFVLGNGEVLGEGSVVFQSDTTVPAAAALRPGGTVEGWRSKVGAYCQNNPLMIVAVSLAFAGPLLEPLGMDGGGMHLRGASSRGKSTILRVAASVWGSPDLVQTWRATTNGLEGVASAFNATLLPLDELGEARSHDVGEAAYMLANGQGKTRANRKGAARPAQTWRLMVLSTGELSLSDKMAEAGRRIAAGQEVRFVELQADERPYGAFDDLHGCPDGAAFARLIAETTSRSFGVAGPAFVSALLADRDASLAQARRTMSAFLDAVTWRHGLTGEGQTQRVAYRLGLVAAAGELATAFGLTGWLAGTAEAALKEAFGWWLEGRGGEGPLEVREAIRRTRDYLITYGDSRFGRLDGGDTPVHQRAGWRDEDTFYIDGSAWGEIHAGADPIAAARALRDVGLLRTGDGANLMIRLSSAVCGRPRAYAVPVEILGAG